MNEPALAATGVTKSFSAGRESVDAVCGVEIELHAGEFVAVVGPSGCGKSTLLHMLGGLTRPTAGEVRWAGERIDHLPESRLAKRRRHEVGFVFQFFNLVPALTVAENIALPLLLCGAGRRTARRRATELVDLAGLGDQVDAAAGQLSGGEQQRVAIARALAARPAVVLADEPTGSLDSSTARSVLGLLRETCGDGQALMIVTHDPRVAAAADRVVLLNDGRVVEESRLGPGRPVGDLVSLGGDE